MTIDPLTVPRPQSLSDVAARALEGETFDLLLREFLDRFYGADAAERTLAIAQAPTGITAIEDAYLGAVAEHLARRFGLAIPAWTDEPSRFLTEPFFAGGLESLKATLLVESPSAFRRRQIFVSANALSRASEYAWRP